MMALPMRYGRDRVNFTGYTTALSAVCATVSMALIVVACANTQARALQDGGKPKVRAPIPEQQVIPGAPTKLTTLRASESGALIVAGGADGSIRTWAAQAGEEGRTIYAFGPRTSVTALEITASDKEVLALASDGKVAVADLSSGNCRPVGTFELRSVRAIAYASSSKAAAFAHERCVTIMNTETWREVGSVEPSGEPTCMVFAPDGNWLFVGVEGALSVWNVPSLKLAGTIDLPKERPTSIVAAPDGKSFMVAVSDSKDVRQYAITTRELLSTMPTKADVVSVAAGKDGTLFTTDSRGAVTAWDRTAKCFKELVEPKEGHCTLLAPLPSLGFAVVVGKGIRLYAREAAECTLVRTLTSSGHEDAVLALVFSPDGKLLASTSTDGSVKLWEIATRSLVFTMKPHDGKRVTGLAFSRDGRSLASAGAGASVAVIDIETKSVSFRISNADRGYEVTSLCLGPDAAWIATGDAAGEVAVWSRSGAKLATVAANDLRRGVTSLATTPDGVALFALSENGVFRSWQRDTGALIASSQWCSGKAVSGVVSPEADLVVAGSEAEELRIGNLKDVAAGSQLFSKNDGIVTSVGISPEGSYIASTAGLRDSEIRLWEPATRSQIGRFRGHTDRVWCTVFSRDGSLLASAGADRTIRLWRVRPWRAPTGPRNPPTAAELNALWEQLGAREASQGYEALSVLSTRGADVVPYLVKGLRSSGPDHKKVEALLGDMDLDDIGKRDAATTAIVDLGEDAEDVIIQKMKGTSKELEVRLQAILTKIRLLPARSAGQLRAFRALQILEAVSNEAAMQMVQELKSSSPWPSVRREATKVWERRVE